MGRFRILPRRRAVLAERRPMQIDERDGAARLYGGTGLGPPISKGLIEAHHGQLVIDSSPGRGTRVRVIRPPHAAAPVPVTGAKPRASRKARDDRAVA